MVAVVTLDDDAELADDGGGGGEPASSTLPVDLAEDEQDKDGAVVIMTMDRPTRVIGCWR